MNWRVGFPEPFRFLDDEHEALGRKLMDIRQALDDRAGADAKSNAIEFLKMLDSHIENENRVMEQVGYPENEIHELYHEVSVDNVETLLRFFDRESAQRNREEITKHLENRLEEEMQFDRQLVEHLKTMAYGLDAPGGRPMRTHES